MYGQSEYGTITYSQDTQISIEDIEKYKVDLYKYVPSVILNMAPMKKILDLQSIQLGVVKYQIQDLINQAFIDTATWSLDLWEEEYGIDTNPLLSYEDRREIIKAKKRGRGTTTIGMIKNTAEAFSGGECNVIPHNDQYSFTVHFIGVKGIPRNMQAFKDMLEIIKPAHLAYNFEYTYNTWGMLKDSGLTWDQAKNMTWDEIRTYG